MQAAAIVIPKHIWQRLLLKLPPDHDLFSHSRCRTCQRADGSRLTPSTIAHIGMVVCDAADTDGTSIYRSVPTIAAGAKRSRATVLAALGHLQTVSLLTMASQGGGRGRPRGKPSIYHLTVPSYDVLTLIGVDISALMRGYDQLQQVPAVHDWFTRAAV